MAKNKGNLGREFGICRRGKAIDQLQKEAKAANSRMSTFTAKMLKTALDLDDYEIDSQNRINVGNVKGLKRALKKIELDYSGDTTQIDDVCRCQVFTHTPKEIKKILEFVTQQYRITTTNFRSKGWQSPDRRRDDNLWAGIRIRAVENANGELELKDFKNHIAHPKRWGWQGLTLKLETQLNNGNWVPFEIQIFPEQMKQAYEQSHKLYEMVREEVSEWAQYCKTVGNVKIETYFRNIRPQLAPEIPPKHNENILTILESMIEMHRLAGKEAGLDELQEEAFPTIETAQPNPANEEEVRQLNDLTFEPVQDWKRALLLNDWATTAVTSIQRALH